MKSVFTPIRPSHSRTLRAMNSGPLSERMCSGGRCATNSSVRQWSTSSDLSLRATTMARQRRVLIDHGEHAKAPPVFSAVLHEVVGPHVIGPLRSEPDARAVVEPEPPALGLLLWYFQPFPPPDAIHALDAHVPALVEEQAADAPVAIAPVPGRQPHDRLRQSCFVSANSLLSTLRRARLTDNRTRAALRNGELRAHVVHARPLAGRA